MKRKSKENQEKLSPGRRQYLNIKNQYQDCLLLYRMGDFYETFDEDAKILSSVLDIALTARDVGSKNKVPLAGIPYHSLDNSLSKLMDSGLKVAIAEQTSDPKEAKGIVDRAVTRVLTPGTITAPDMLNANEHNFLVSIVIDKDEVDISALDVSTGKFETYFSDLLNLQNEIERLSPKEIIFVKSDKKIIFDYFSNYHLREYMGEVRNVNIARNVILSHFEIENLSQIQLENRKTLLMSVGIILDYINSNYKDYLKNIISLNNIDRSKDMILDFVTLRDLEITKSLTGTNEVNTLYQFMDRTKTPMGARLLRNIILTPSQDLELINDRQNKIQWFNQQHVPLQDLDEKLGRINDIERIINRIFIKNCSVRDLISLYHSLNIIPEIFNLLAESNFSLKTNLKEINDISEYLITSINMDTSSDVGSGEIIKKGFNLDLDDLVEMKFHSNSLILQLEESERKRTQINNLKIRYNRVFGYYIEITKSHLNNIPDNYIRRQTLANAERFYTDELKDLEEKILNADEKINNLEVLIFDQVCDNLSSFKKTLLQLSNEIAMIDSIYSFAKIAYENNWVRPIVSDDKNFEIKDALHPVIDKILGFGTFVPNDLIFENHQNTAIITGANMAGKSTFLRTIAIQFILAQIGSFVPASRCKIGVVDRIFTRTGLTDDISSGKSTFLIEMEETARILRLATNKSFAILDEIGRGTSTYDGLAIAWSILEYINNNPHKQFRTLFATHYHELTDLPNLYKNIINLHVAVKEENNSINFLHRIVEGSSERSYGINVAEIAGIPEEVISQSKILLEKFENNTITTDEGVQMDLFNDNNDEVVEKLKSLDLNTISPIEAINFLNKIKKQID
ncbi:MAG: DNA mismatch repair protein MutS [Chloroflexi bacterium]|nr:DNA mismatch repair protein MutS [Chloroflexota bacterium]|tara:strand:- start:1300 stop:3861 length:2562 start_codon:yes stop_codon:yes gene_type:complete